MAVAQLVDIARIADDREQRPGQAVAKGIDVVAFAVQAVEECGERDGLQFEERLVALQFPVPLFVDRIG